MNSADMTDLEEPSVEEFRDQVQKGKQMQIGLREMNSKSRQLLKFVDKKIKEVKSEFDEIMLKISADLGATVIRNLYDVFRAAQTVHDEEAVQKQFELWTLKSGIVENNLKELWSYVDRDIRSKFRELHVPHLVNPEIVRAKRFYRASEFTECGFSAQLADNDDCREAPSDEKDDHNVTVHDSSSTVSNCDLEFSTMRGQRLSSGYVEESSENSEADKISSVCVLDHDCVAALRLHGTEWQIGDMKNRKWCALRSSLVTFAANQCGSKPGEKEEDNIGNTPDLRLVPISKHDSENSLLVLNFSTGYASLFAVQASNYPKEKRHVKFRGAMESFCFSDACNWGLVTYCGAQNGKSEILSCELKSAAFLRKDRQLQYFRYSLIGKHRLCLVEDSYYHLVDLFDVAGNKLRAICPQQSSGWMHIETMLTGKQIVSSWSLQEDERKLTIKYQTVSWYDEDRRNVSESRYVTMEKKKAKKDVEQIQLASTSELQCFDTLEPLESDRTLLMDAERFCTASDRKRATQCYVNSIIGHGENAWLLVDPQNAAVKQVRRLSDQPYQSETTFRTHETRDTVSGICKLNDNTLLVIINCMKAECVELDSGRTLDTIHFSQHHRFSVSQAFVCHGEQPNTLFVFIGGSDLFFKLRVEISASGVSFATRKLRLRNVVARFAQDDSLHKQFTLSVWCRETNKFQVYILTNCLSVRRVLTSPKLKPDVDWLPLRSAVCHNCCIVYNWNEMTLYLYDFNFLTITCIQSGVRVHAMTLSLAQDTQNGSIDIVIHGFAKRRDRNAESGLFLIKNTSQSYAPGNNPNQLSLDSAQLLLA